MFRLDGKVAIVTGGARGQGEAEVRLFAAEGTYMLDVTIDQAAAEPQPLRFGLDMVAVGRDPANVLAAWRPIARARPLGGIVSDKWAVAVQISTSADAKALSSISIWRT